MSRLLLSLATLTLILFSTKTYATCSSYCGSFNFPAVYYDEMCYATIGGADPSGAGHGCENTFHTMPSGWSVAAAEANTITVANAYNWDTLAIVFNYPDTSGIKGVTGTYTGSANWDGPCGLCYVVHEAPDQYRSSYCFLRVLISTPCSIPGQQCGECVSSCIGLDDGDYTSCSGCDVYASCSNQILIDNRACPAGGLVWDDAHKICNWESHCATGPCDYGTNPNSDTPDICTDCVDDCDGVANGDYMSCNGCNVYASCSGGILTDNRPCPGTLVWNDALKICDYQSSCDGGDCPGP